MIKRLKIWPSQYIEVVQGHKKAEFRKNDQDFTRGDCLLLEEFDPVRGVYTGKTVQVLVTCVTVGFGIPDGFVMMSIRLDY